MPQTLVGNIWSSARNLAGLVDQVKYFKGATYVINDNSSKYRGITLGNYINMDIKREYTKEKYEPSWNGGKFTPAVDDMMMHEYGHYLQSQMIGLFYLPAAGLPSLLNRIGWIGTSDKDYFYTEKWANNLSFDFFDSPVDKWDLEKYPVDNLLYDAHKAVQHHICTQHSSVFNYYLGLGKIYTGLSASQTELAKLFYKGYSDKEIVEMTESNSTSTIRNQRFSIREKYKQAKILTALIEMLEEQMAQAKHGRAQASAGRGARYRSRRRAHLRSGREGRDLLQGLQRHEGLLQNARGNGCRH